MTPMYNNGFYQQYPIQQQYQPQFNYQGYAQQVQPQVAVKTVNDFGEITANDVSMQTPYSIFVKSDLSELQVRKWNNLGTIDISLFKPVLEDNPNKLSNEVEKRKFDLSEESTRALCEYFDNRIDKLESLIKPKKAKAGEK